MTTDSLIEVLRAHFRSRGLTLTTANGEHLTPTESAYAVRELALVARDAILSGHEPTVVMSAEMLANMLGLDKMLEAAR